MSEIYRRTVSDDEPNNPHSFALQMVGSGQRVLELGCSVGHVTEQLVARGNTVVGVEIDPSAAEQARRFAERVHVADLDVVQVSSLEAGPFDVIVAGDVFEHLRDPEPVLADLTGLLADDGRLVVSIPNVAHADVRLMLLEGRWEYQPDGVLDRTHQRWFTGSTLRRFLADAGFIATRVERVVHPRGGTSLPVDHGAIGPTIAAFVDADPESTTYQFVVEARRKRGRDDAPDALDDVSIPVDWPAAELDRPDLERRCADLAAENAALRAELDAWQQTILVRATRPLRSVWGKIKGVSRP